jgi:Transcriptional regulators
MKIDLIQSADAVGLFCRLHMKSKKELPIRSSEMGVLIYTSKQTDAVTPLMISQFFKITKPAVTTMVNALVNKGYLIRTASTIDKRSYTLEITSEGRTLVESTYEAYIEVIETLYEGMGEAKFKAFVELISEANAILSEERS